LVNIVLLRDKSLETLNIRFNKVTNRGALALSELGEHPTLTIMNLKMNAIGAKGAEALARMLESNSTLKTLNLRNQTPRLPNSVAMSFAIALHKNTTLRRIKLRRNRIEDSGARALVDSIIGNARSALVELDLQQNYVGVSGGLAFVDLLAAVSTIEFVYAGENRFSRGELLEKLELLEVYSLDSRFELAIKPDI